MNSMMNIQIRVAARQAMSEVAALQTQIASLQRQTIANSATSAASSVGAIAGMKAWATSMTAAGSRLQWLGRQISYNVAMPLALLGGVAMKWALDNEKAVTRIYKVYGNLADGTAKFAKTEVPALTKAFILLSNKYGIVQAQMENIAADWAQAGASGVALAKATELTARTMVLGEMDQAEATKALISIQGQLGVGIGENSTKATGLNKVLNILNMTENETAISMQGLIEVFQRSAGTARNAGIDVEHLAAMAAAMVPAAGSAASAGNALKTMISRLLSPTKDASALFQKVGIDTGSVAWQSMNASKRLEALSVSFNKLNGNQKAVISTYVAGRYQINRFDVLMRDIIDKNGNYQKVLKDTADTADNFRQAQAELNTVLDSSPNKLEIIKVRMQNALTSVIQPMLGPILILVGAIAGLAIAFSNLDPNVQKTIMAFFAFIAVFGLFMRIVGIVMILVGSFAKVLMLPVVALQWLAGAHTRSAEAAQAAAAIEVAAAAERTAANEVAAAATAASYAAEQAARDALAASYAALAAAQTAATGATLGAAAAQIESVFAQDAAILAADAHTAALGIESGAAYAYATAQQAVVASAAELAFAESALATAQAGGSGFLRQTQLAFELDFAEASLAVATMELVNADIALTAAGIATTSSFAEQALAAEAAAGASHLAATAQGEATLAASALAGAETKVATAGAAAATSTRGVWVAAAGPILLIGTLIAGVAVLVYIFRDRIVEAFWGMVRGIQSAFNRLPGVIRAPLLAVVESVAAAGRAVYRWLQYINPFAKHSPALVDEVGKGAGIIGSHHSNIQSSAKGARSEIASTNTAVSKATPLKTAAIAKSIPQKAAADVKNAAPIFAAIDKKQAGVDRASVSKSMPTALKQYDILIADLAKLNPLLDQTNAAYTKQNAVVDQWKAKLDSANVILDTQQGKLNGLNDKLSGLTGQYDAHKQAMQDYANAPIAGMKDMNDAIFDNEQAQKKLQLQILQWTIANGSIDDTKNKMALLAGDIEKLTGSSSDLRKAGAGSDVLGPINAQIAQMKGAYGAMGKAVNDSPVKEAQKKLAVLQQESQVLDLQKSITFDPVIKQINDLVNAQKELSAEEIIAGIKREQAAMAALQPQIDAVNKAIAAQQVVVDKATEARDAASKQYDIETAKLDVLKKSYDSIKESIDAVTEATQRMISESANIEAAKKAAEPKAKKAPSAKELSPALAAFKDASVAGYADIPSTGKVGRESMADETAKINEYTKQMEAEAGKSFSGMDMFKPIKDAWNTAVEWLKKNVSFKGIGESLSGSLNFAMPASMTTLWNSIKEIWGTLKEFGGSIKDLFGPTFTAIWENIKTAFLDAVQPIKGKLDALGASFSGFGDAMHNIGVFLQVVFAAIALVVMGAFSVIASVIKNTIGPLVTFFVEIFGNIITFITGFVNIIIGIFTGDWAKAWEGIKQVFSALWDEICSILKVIPKVIWGIVKGLVEGVVNFFVWLWDMLVGHSIIPDMINSIIDWFKSMFTPIFNAVKSVVDAVVGFFNDLWNNIKNWWNNTVLPFMVSIGVWLLDTGKGFLMAYAALPGRILGFFTNVWTNIQSWWNNTVLPFMVGIGTWLLNTGSGFLMAYAALPGRILGFFTGIWTNIHTWWNVTVLPFMVGIGTWLLNTGSGFLMAYAALPGRILGFFTGIWTNIHTWWNVTVLPFMVGIGTWLLNVKDGFMTSFAALPGKVLGFFTGIWTNIQNWWNVTVKPFLNGIGGFLLNTKDGFMSFWSKLPGAIETVWTDIVSKIKTGANLAMAPLNALFHGINSISDKLSLGIHIPDIAFAQGGVVPSMARGGGRVNQARSIVGEGNSNYPEYVIPTDPSFRDRALSLYSQLGDSLNGTNRATGTLVPGSLPYSGDIATPVYQHAKGAVLPPPVVIPKVIPKVVPKIEVKKEDDPSFLRGMAIALFKTLTGGLKEQFDRIPFFGSIGNAILSKAVAWIGQADAKLPTSDAGGGTINTGAIGDIKKWLPSLTSLPYIWGGVGPGGYDCSGITGEVWARLMGKPSYRRYMTTLSDFGSMGFKRGTGVYTIGVNDHHMVGSLDGVKFEAPHTGVNLRVGSAAQSTSNFPEQYYLASLGQQLALGGIATRAVKATVGEAGAEAILPLGAFYAHLDLGFTRQVEVLRRIDMNTKPNTSGSIMQSSKPATVNFYGDLSFPNVKSGDDAEAFISNLKTLGG